MGRSLRTGLVKKSIASIFATLLVVVALPNAWGQSAGTASTPIVKMRTLQIDAWARPGVGQFVPADDDVQHLAYELFVTSWHYTKDLRFAAVDVEDATTGKRLARFDSKALEDPFTLRINQYPGKEGPANRLLPAGRTAILTLDVKLPLGASVPGAVRHRIQFESDPSLQLIQDEGSLSSELIAFSEPLLINRARPLVIGPPLRGGPWRCANGFGHGNSHGWIGATEKIARMYVAQRFGCDFSKVDPQGDVLPSPFPAIINNSMFYGYGADVIAVAAGRVVIAQDGIPENVPQIDGRVIPPFPLTDRTYPGNMVVLKIGKGQYVFYAHLQLGSLRVKVGDRVRKGQLLGKVGNAGNSVGPHLHFHICNGPGPNSCDPVPHVYRSYWLSGYARYGQGPWIKPDPAKRRWIDFKVPTEWAFMTFPSK
ncbi:MAG TPA: M23 family metallopeptidase [Pyrinomonadaceae bacterium]|nr:M23 family metallopeptidase [Pyrinomonadaceae bacterium]